MKKMFSQQPGKQMRDFGGVVIIIGFTAFVIAMLKNDLAMILGWMMLGGGIYYLGLEEEKVARTQGD